MYYRNLLIDSIKEDTVVLGIKDHLTGKDFNYWNDKEPDIVTYLRDMFSYYSDKRFILLTSVENLESYIDNKT